MTACAAIATRPPLSPPREERWPKAACTAVLTTTSATRSAAPTSSWPLEEAWPASPVSASVRGARAAPSTAAAMWSLRRPRGAGALAGLAGEVAARPLAGVGAGAGPLLGDGAALGRAPWGRDLEEVTGTA